MTICIVLQDIWKLVHLAIFDVKLGTNSSYAMN